MMESLFDDVKRMDKRQFFYQVLSFGMIVSSALMIWKGLMVVTGSESPIVVVLSGSMEPAFHRGDLLFLTNYEKEDIRVGEIVVFKVNSMKYGNKYFLRADYTNYRTYKICLVLGEGFARPELAPQSVITPPLCRPSGYVGVRLERQYSYFLQCM
jgi:hypothetical protein